MGTIRVTRWDFGPIRIQIGRFQTLFPRSVRFSNLDKISGASYFSFKITAATRIWAAFTLRGQRYWQTYSWSSLFEKYPIKSKIFNNFITIGIRLSNCPKGFWLNSIGNITLEISDIFYFWNIFNIDWFQK